LRLRVLPDFVLRAIRSRGCSLLPSLHSRRCERLIVTVFSDEGAID